MHRRNKGGLRTDTQGTMVVTLPRTKLPLSFPTLKPHLEGCDKFWPVTSPRFQLRVLYSHQLWLPTPSFFLITYALVQNTTTFPPYSDYFYALIHHDPRAQTPSRSSSWQCQLYWGYQRPFWNILVRRSLEIPFKGCNHFRSSADWRNLWQLSSRTSPITTIPEEYGKQTGGFGGLSANVSQG